MITVEVNSTDVTAQIAQGSLRVVQRITHLVDSAFFVVRKIGDKTLTPQYGDEVAIYDGATKIFGGSVLSVEQEPITNRDGTEYRVNCVDHIYEMDKRLASKTYENQTVKQIIDDLISSYTTGFTTTGVTSTFNVEKIVFNQVPLSTCIRRLADALNYDWDVDVNKDVQFFAKYSKTASFSLTDTNGNYIYKTLRRIQDGSEVVNRVKVRGGLYNGATFSDSITVVGNETKSFRLPYRFDNLSITLDTGGGPVAQTIGVDFINDFSTADVLYNFQEQTIRWETNLSDTDVIAFSGNPKVPVFAISEDPVSIATYGVQEKLIRDNSIESNTIARRRANAELYTYSEPIVDATFETYNSGLEAGMTISIQSDLQNINDDLIIKSLTFEERDHNNFRYRVNLISTKRYDFVSLLQKLIEPESRLSDEQETSEEIFTDTQNVEITEEYEVVSAVEDHQTVNVSENYEIDPLGDETNALYVLSPYSPTSQSDTKRPGRLNISLAVY